jgi:hypothetical protein
MMELVLGDTLADKISSGPILLEEALEAVHAKGLVDWDLKSTNIKLTEAGLTTSGPTGAFSVGATPKTRTLGVSYEKSNS